MGEISYEMNYPMVLRYFTDICKIPHPSGYEKALSDYLFLWAREQNLLAQQDSFGNLYIRKEASPGMEEKDAVVLSAHLDMVADKVSSSDFDFLNEGIKWQLDGDIISTGGQTTLGADDGAGLAMIMAVLTDRKHAYPAVEAILTIMEEEDFSGAEKFEFPFQAKYLINLDGSYDDMILCASSGGMDAEVNIELGPMIPDSSYKSFHIGVEGMAGGHSGREIGCGRDSALCVLSRYLMAIKEHTELFISKLSVGNSYIAIPQNAAVDIVIPGKDTEFVKKYAELLEKTVQKEHPLTGDQIHIFCEPADYPEKVYCPEKIMQLLMLSPNGIVQMNEMYPAVVSASVNLGYVRLNDGKLHARYDIRALNEGYGKLSYMRIKLLAEMLGGSCKNELQYPSWPVQKGSALTSKAKECYISMFHKEPKVSPIHVGLEVGYFFRKKKDLDAIAIGPLRWGAHTPKEAMSVSSLEKMTEFLSLLIREL